MQLVVHFLFSPAHQEQTRGGGRGGGGNKTREKKGLQQRTEKETVE